MQHCLGRAVGTRKRRQGDVIEVGVDGERLGGVDRDVLGKAAVQLRAEGVAVFRVGAPSGLHRAHQHPLTNPRCIDGTTDGHDRSGGIGALNARKAESDAIPAAILAHIDRKAVAAVVGTAHHVL